MEPLGRAEAIDCRRCGTRFDPRSTDPACPDCGSLREVVWEPRAPDESSLKAPVDSMWDFSDLLPVDHDHGVSMGEGGTPLVSTPALATEIGVESVWIKDEGQNPTGSAVDRELALAMAVATRIDVSHGSLAAAGAAGQSFAAYAARAGLEGSLYLPARAPFETKAMANVHDIDLTVVRGRFEDAREELETERAAGITTVPFGAFESPWRILGASTIAPEIVAGLGMEVPDAVVVPTGTGSLLVGIFEGFKALADLDLVRELPSLVAVQASGCAPLVDAVRSGNPVERVETPDTICGELEIANPPGGSWLLEAIEERNGTAVAVPDNDILDAGLSVAQRAGLELRPDAAAGPAGLVSLSTDGYFDDAEQIVIIGTGSGGADVLRNHRTVRGP